jgi:chloramphenicol-sensitive protein RarD
MTHPRNNLLAWIAAIAAYTIWGAMPLFWRLFEGTPAFVVFLHRCLWSFPFLVLLTLLANRGSREVLVFDRGRWPWLVLSGFLIGANWWIYIYGVERHQVVEMSMGYFMAPLLTAAMGVVVLREKLSRGQWFGVGLVVVGSILYGFTVSRVPMLAIGLAVTFSGYSLVRKLVKAPPMGALTTEACFLFVVSVFFLATNGPDPSLGEAWTKHGTLLVLGGGLTALPLLWFAYGVRGLTLTSLGMINYISPTGKFLIAILAFGEVVTDQQIWAFCVLWSGIIVYLASTFRRSVSPLQPE